MSEPEHNQMPEAWSASSGERGASNPGKRSKYREKGLTFLGAKDLRHDGNDVYLTLPPVNAYIRLAGDAPVNLDLEM